MKRKLVVGVLSAIMLFSVGFSSEVGAHGMNEDVELTAEQMDEMATLQEKALEKKVEIINKYVEFGVFTEEKGKKMISFVEKKYNELKENNFIPKWDKHKKHDH
ncbi:YckD family protein [Evansella cellulosilytica]|uniref:DUF2680 domain-containing protein n=1 Tax=Evansella cellulosilytica (strain ATCC 21833 / DSM 2522 / FERM P-1141 / JCM 9156 / N-4) TaxID=649639 RepID=E6TX28_EVAC2|nr:YckD family protein [Evansella cellulosilytica]ADU31117.1 hypothetical protein Bcell_2865 [Evansella cellulosilytica DSM 2522]